MHSYSALLGIHPAISVAELSALLPDFLPSHRFGGQFYSFETEREIDQAFLNRLGGTIMIAKRITGESAVGIDDLPVLLQTELKGVKGKAVFSLRLVGVSPKRANALFKDCKQHLKSHGIPSRYVGGPGNPPKPIQLHDEGLLDPKSGCELVVLADKENLWIGRTVAAQDVKAYTLRDIEKPVRDTTVGLLPPKLAQILLNFGEYLTSPKPKAQSPKLLVLDPFCGTGVIPLEALLRGQSSLASDVSLKAVNGTTKNIEWARKTYKIGKKDPSSEVWKQDATKPFELKEKPDVIVTEGSLGPALNDRPNIKDVESLRKNADDLTIAFLKNCAATLPGVPVVMTLPIWYAQKRMIHLEKVWQTVTELKYTPVLPPHTDPSIPGHFSQIYRRADQFVGREIVMLKPKI
jgi:hypothetical protein